MAQQVEVMVDDAGNPFAVQDPQTGLWLNGDGQPYDPDGSGNLATQASLDAYLAQLTAQSEPQPQFTGLPFAGVPEGEGEPAATDEEYQAAKFEFLGSDPRYAHVDPEVFDRFVADDSVETWEQALGNYNREMNARGHGNELSMAIDDMFREEVK